MKRTLLILGLLALLAVLTANPAIDYPGLSQVWFDAGGDFWMVYRPTYLGNDVYEDLHDLVIGTTGGSWQLPDTYTQPGTSHCDINLTEEIPGFTINRQADRFIVMNGVEENKPLRWGLDSGYEIDLRPLQDGQYARVQYMFIDFNSDTPFGTFAWIKVSNQTVPINGCPIRISIQDDQGHPVENYPIRLYFGNPDDGHYVTLSTAENGLYEGGGFYMLHQLKLIDPLSGELIAQHFAYPEPGEEVNWSVTIPCPHNQNYSSQILKITPNLIHGYSQCIVNISYTGYWLLNSGSYVNLYDLRGRKLLSSPFPSGQTEWTLPALANGIYFIALHSEHQILARGRITVIK